jgi:predicted esterase
MKKSVSTSVLVASGLMLIGCGDEGPVVPEVTTPMEASVHQRAGGPAQIEGRTGPGALYGLYLPAEWNGDLALYAHGYTDPAAPVALPGRVDLRDALLALGYGVAWSSYSENGYAVKDGVIRTRQLRGLFASKFGMPKRTYLMGHSLGGIITLMSAEKNPGLYAGALPMCSLVGGGALELDYIYHVRALFDYSFPGVIPGSVLDVPEGLTFEAVAPAVIGAILADPAAAQELAGVDQIELPYTNFNQLIESILFPLFFNIVGTEDFFDRTHRVFVDNSMTVYTGSLDDAALNAGVERYAAAPNARDYLERWYQPKGNLKIPVLTLHTTMDPVVPLFHESAYASIVDAAGRSDLLVQRVVDRYGHCTFTADEQISAFLDLVNWAESGVAPAP